MLGIIGAMDEEISAYIAVLKKPKRVTWNRYDIHTGILNNVEVVIVKSGVGKVLSAMITQRLIDTFPLEHIIFTGIAGSLNPEYEIGDVVIAKDTGLHDMDARGLGYLFGEIPFTDIRFVECDSSGASALIQACRDLSVKVHQGRVLTGDLFLTDKNNPSYSYLYDEMSGDAVEMEGASTGIVSYLNNIPFNLIRVISDKADGHAPENFNSFLAKASETSLNIVMNYTALL